MEHCLPPQKSILSPATGVPVAHQVDGVMQPHILATGTRHLDDKISAGYQIAQLAQLLGKHRAVVKVFCLSEDEVQTVEGALQTQVAANDADIVPHQLLQLAFGLGDKHHLLVQHHTLGIPIGHGVA